MSPGETSGATERVDGLVARLAARQHGLVTHSQVVSFGVSPMMIHARTHDGRWIRIHRGVYAIAGHPVTWHRSMLAACFALGPDAVASHGAAARIWRLPGFETAQIEASTITSGGRRATFRVHRIQHFNLRDIGRADEIPVTRPARTIIDLAGSLSPTDLEACLDEALRRRMFTLRTLRERLDELSGRGRGGVTALRALLAERARGGAVAESVLETRLSRLLRRARLPEPVQQHQVALPGYGTVRIDFAYPDRRLAIEADGYRWHGDRGAWSRDLERRNALTAAGWRILHVTWQDIERREADTIARIAEALGVRAPYPAVIRGRPAVRSVRGSGADPGSDAAR